MFLFVGADPETRWLASCGVTLDSDGFVLTGQAAGSAVGRAPAPLESSVPGVFAVGDVRSGSVKRVGGAIGEGAAAVAQIHQYLAATHPVSGAERNGRGLKSCSRSSFDFTWTANTNRCDWGRLPAAQSCSANSCAWVFP